MKLRKIKWKKHVELEEIRAMEAFLRKEGRNPLTNFKFHETDLWVTLVY